VQVNEVAEKYNGTAEMCKDLHEYNTTARSTRRLMPTASCSTLQQDLQPMMQPEMKQDLQPMMQPEMKRDLQPMMQPEMGRQVELIKSSIHRLIYRSADSVCGLNIASTVSK